MKHGIEDCRCWRPTITWRQRLVVDGDDAAYDDDEEGVMQRKKKQKLISKVG